jgi:hypothetical protein
VLVVVPSPFELVPRIVLRRTAMKAAADVQSS